MVLKYPTVGNMLLIMIMLYKATSPAANTPSNWREFVRFYSGAISFTDLVLCCLGIKTVVGKGGEILFGFVSL